MGDRSQIQWTDATWNPVTGCAKVSPGCAQCYAERLFPRAYSHQFVRGDGLPVTEVDPPTTSIRPRRFTDVQCHEDRLDQPLRWKKPRKIFVNSMSDLFHEAVPDAFIDRVFAVMALAPQHTFQILTKRAERMKAYFDKLGFEPERLEDAAEDFDEWAEPDLPLPNVWLGVSVENQHFADERIPLLTQTPAAVRFLSCEPLLEGLDIAKHRPGANRLWIIVGGESGKAARPCDVRWVRSIVRQGQEAGCPVFVKQLGRRVITRNDDGWEGDTPRSWPMDTDYEENIHGYRDDFQGADVRVKLLDSHGGDPNEWPEDLRVREFPPSRNAEATSVDPEPVA